MKFELKTRQICFFFLAFLPVTKIFAMPSIVAKFAAEDMWISIIINSLIDFLTMLFIILLCKNENKTYFEILENVYGKVVSKIILMLYVLFFMLKIYLPLNEQKDYTLLTLYITSPDIIIFLPLFFVTFFLSLKKLKIIGRCADFLWIFSLLGLLIIFFLSISNVNLEALLPVGASGKDQIFQGSYSVLIWFGDSIYFIFLIGEYEKSKHYALKILLCYAAALLSILVLSIIFWCTFSSIASRQRFALTEISKYLKVITKIGRFDFIAIFFLLFSNIFTLSFPFYFACRILNKIFKVKCEFLFSLILIVLQIISILVFQQKYFSILVFIIKYGGALSLFFSNILPIFTLIINKIKNKEKKYEIQIN